jgi:hypothetical protein
VLLLMNVDRHATARDRKAAAAKTGKLMRGNRSVFAIQNSILKRAAKAGTR